MGNITDQYDGLSGIAVIGMAGRFPGANSVDALWQNLCIGVECVTFFSDNELDPTIDSSLKSDPNYVKARGILDDVDKFDAIFFGINPREAEIMDPQQRVFLEVAWEALENAGYAPTSLDGLVGVYAGMSNNTYLGVNVAAHPDRVEQVGQLVTMMANEKDYLATRVSYKLNLKGPSVNVYTACSTSLVAVCEAFHSLMSYQCDMALAGGISITFPQNRGYLYQDGGIVSPDGHCRPFDAQAQGTVFGSGVGIVALKRVDDAMEDGDQIHAVIHGVGLNNDGSEKVSFTAPSVDGQAEAIAMSHAQAECDPATIGYVETHGTATPLGDPIEVAGLTQAFRVKTQRKNFCAIGSIKGNLGHLDAAAGVAGFIKTVMSLKHKQLPPSLHFEKPSPKLGLADSPFYVNATLSEWRSDGIPRRAGVSSFGVGGTNAHVVLEEAPKTKSSGPSRPRQLLLLSAKTETALDVATANLLEFLHNQRDINLADACYTLQRGRQAFNYRRLLVCTDVDDSVQALQSRDPKRIVTRHVEQRDPAVVFMFPGQGAQYVNMGRSLYDYEPTFREEIDRCAEILKPKLGRDLREVLYPRDEDSEGASRLLRETFFTQPALFTIEYALAKLWISWGVRPEAMIGHSIGEFVVACIAEVFSLDDALTLVATRGRLMQDLPSGAMLSARLPAREVNDRLGPELSIAAVNGPSLCVVSGPTEAVEKFQRKLEDEGTICRHLQTSHAFHSPMMDPIIEPFAECVRDVTLSAPRVPFVSTVTATWITPEQATDPLYWAKHLRQTVRFAEGVQKLWENPERVLLEVGPRMTTATLARQQAKHVAKQVVVSSLGDTAVAESEWEALLNAVGQLWLAGVSIDWADFYARESRRRIALPTYPFERKRFWVAPVSDAVVDTNANNLSERLIPTQQQHDDDPPVTAFGSGSRKERLVSILQETLMESSGLDLTGTDESTSLLELGFDSLFLTQASLILSKKFGVEITFRQLLEDLVSVQALAEYLDQNLPPEAVPAATAPKTPATPLVAAESPATLNQNNDVQAGGAGLLERVIAEQMQIMTQQLEMIRSYKNNDLPPVPASPGPEPSSIPTPLEQSMEASRTSKPASSVPTQAFGPAARISKIQGETLTAQKQTFLDELIKRYTTRTNGSKRFTQNHRSHLADPRTVSGFSPLWKEMIYPIVAERSSGAKIWDIDGNEYIDLTNGFGIHLFGHSPSFVLEAVKSQLERGIEIGPQNVRAGMVAQLIHEITGSERVAFCNTGSEAVLAAMRLARTVTGRSLVAMFAGGYHGIFDEVIARAGHDGRSRPASPGILPSAVEHILILEYGSPESLEILEARADELAAVLVEPVQSRQPDLQPKEFLIDLRKLTESSGAALILDEVVTGFRVHPAGIQGLWGIQADLATYGKVVGGGLPIGIVAGKAAFMDGLDGGAWQYGDASFPQVGVTYFAGTFVRHPLALAAAEAVLEYLKQSGPALQERLNQKVHEFVQNMNAYFQHVRAPIKLTHFSSFFCITFDPDLPYTGLFFFLLREKGIHVWEGRPCFFTTVHSEADIAAVNDAFRASVEALQKAEFLPGTAGPREVALDSASMTEGAPSIGAIATLPPLPGARLGRAPNGDPGWFAPDPERPGKYVQVGNA